MFCFCSPWVLTALELCQGALGQQPSWALQSRKHASKVRLYYMLHPRDGGCPAKRLRSENGNDADMVDKNKCCTLCNMSFTSAVVADSHYQGKIHAKRLKLLLGEKTPLKTTATPLNSLKPPRVDTAPVVASPYQRRDSDRYCGLCAAWFNNPLMAQQHYDGKKHKKNAARVALLEQLGTTLDMGELRGLRRNYRCTICSVSLNSIEQYHAHLKGAKHQTKLARLVTHLLFPKSNQVRLLDVSRTERKPGAWTRL
uniref:Zinc finger matrin-type 4 n=1 Tax=Canis lupus familiaris TaxID=9615 RepID=A0A8C0QAC7_CANLF